MKPRTIAVVHREPLVAEAIAAGLARYPAIASVAAVTSATEVEQMAGGADAVVLDAGLRDAPAAAVRLRRRGVRVVFLGEAPAGEEGVHVSTKGRLASLATALVPGLDGPLRGPLTDRQREILTLVARGFAGKQVATRLGISAKTVEHHKTRIFAKLGVRNQAAAVGALVAERTGLEGSWNRSNI